MKKFLTFYRWGMQVKFHMALYTVALILFESLTALLAGRDAVQVLTMLQMLLVSFAMGILEHCLFPGEKDLARTALIWHTVLWAAGANLLFVGGALLFGWFAGAPGWVPPLLLVFLELALFAMWFGLNIALRADTKTLNESLQRYQNRG